MHHIKIVILAFTLTSLLSLNGLAAAAADVAVNKENLNTCITNSGGSKALLEHGKPSEAKIKEVVMCYDQNTKLSKSLKTKDNFLLCVIAVSLDQILKNLNLCVIGHQGQPCPEEKTKEIISTSIQTALDICRI